MQYEIRTVSGILPFNPPLKLASCLADPPASLSWTLYRISA
jgi:hypothetical protein